MKIFLITIFVAILTFAVALPAFAIAPKLESDSELATAGYYRLSWKTDVTGNEDSSDFILEEGRDSEFSQKTILYRGPDTATLISGRPDGVYYYRIRDEQNTDPLNAWSNVTKVTVAHHPLSRAFMFFTLGAIVFVATLIMVIVGNKTNNQ